MPDQFDIVVAGAGHNSLIAAAYLAKAGYRCLVLEGRALVGGGVKTAELTLRGFHHDTCSSAHVLIQDSPIFRNDELKLGDYGLEYLFPDPVVHLPFPDGSYITQWRDLDRTCQEFARFSKKDAEAYRRMMTEYEEIHPLFASTAYTPIGFGKPLNERLAEHPKGKIWQRRLAMSAWEIIRENFEDEHCRAFMVWMAYQTVEPPEAAATGRLAYAICAGRQKWSWTTPRGGSGSLSNALAKLIEANGGVILTDKNVVQLILENGKCTGVECSDGSKYQAQKAVLSTIHIKHLVDMAPKEAFGEDFLAGVETWKAGITLFASHYATTEPPKFPVAGGTISPVAAGTMATAERGLRVSYDFATQNVNVDDPPLLMVCSSVVDPSRAPAGMHTVKIIGNQPYELKEGPRALGRHQGSDFGSEFELSAAICAKSDGRQNSGAHCGEPAGPGTHERAQLARHLPWRRTGCRAIRRLAAGAGMGAASHANSRLIPDRGDDLSGRVGLRRARPQRRNCDAEGFWIQH